MHQSATKPSFRPIDNPLFSAEQRDLLDAVLEALRPQTSQSLPPETVAAAGQILQHLVPGPRSV